MRILLAAAWILALRGCAASGPVIEPAHLAELQKGKTTAADVVKRFGRPSINSDNFDGSRTMAYLQPGHQSEAGALLSLTVALASSSTPNVDSVIFRFDANGVLSDYTRTTQAPAVTASKSDAAKAAPVDSAKPVQPAVAGGTAAQAEAPKPAQPASASSAPARPAPKKPARDDGLPGWLPSGTYDPRNPF